MAGLAGDLTSMLNMMQRRKAMRLEQQRWNEEAPIRAAQTRKAEADAAASEAALAQDSSRGTMQTNQERGVLNPDYSFNSQAIDDIEAGGEGAHEKTLGTMEVLTEGFRTHSQLDPNQRVVGYSKTSDGQYVFEIEYTDGPNAGLIAPLTQNGTSENDDPILPLNRKQVEAIADEGALSIQRASGGTSMVVSGAANDLIDGAYDAQAATQDAVAQINQRLVELSGGKAASRSWMGYLSSLTEEEQQQEIAERAADLGIEVALVPQTPRQTAPNGDQYFGKTPEGEWISFPTEQEQAAAYDRGEVIQATNTTPKTGQFAEEAAAPPPRGPLDVIGREEQANLEARESDRRVEAPLELKAAEKELASLEGKTGRLAINAKIEARRKIERLTAEIEELGKAPAPSPATDTANAPKPTVDYQVTQDKIVSAISSMSPDEVMQRAQQGNFNFITQEDMQNVASLLRERNVKTAAQVRELPPREQMAAWATLAAYAPDADTRTNAITSLRNISETGEASVSARDYVVTPSAGGQNKGDYLTTSGYQSAYKDLRKTATDENGGVDIRMMFEGLNRLSKQVKPGSVAANSIADEQMKLVRQALVNNASVPKGIMDKFVNLFAGEVFNDSSRSDFKGFRKVTNPETDQIEVVQYMGPDGQQGFDINVSEVLNALGSSEVVMRVLERMPEA